MRIFLVVTLVLLCSYCFAQRRNHHVKNIPVKIKGLPVREGLLYKPVSKLEDDIIQPVNGAEIATSQDSCFALTRGNVTAVFNLGDEVACVVRYSNDLLVTYAGLASTFLTKGQLIEKGMLVGLLNKVEDKNILTFMMTTQKGKNLGFDKIAAFVRKNMAGNYSTITPSFASAY